MAKRVPASMRTRESLTDLIEGRLSSADGRAALVKLATRLIVEEALEAESREALGRDYYEHGASPGQGWRNGVRTGRLKTAEGFVDYAAPQIAGREEPFRSEIRESLKGRTQALEDLAVEMLARGLSVRDIEDAFRDESGRLLLSRTAVSEIGERLLAGQAFEGRDPGLVFLDRVSRLGVLVEGAGLVLVHPDPDQGAREVVAARQAMERLAGEILLNDLALEGDTVGAVLCHGR